jgi:CubicO group peptidase (beta-lactamase class C family)
MASFAIVDDGTVHLHIPLEPFRPDRKMVVQGDTFELRDEEGRITMHDIMDILSGLRWLANRESKPPGVSFSCPLS